MNTTRRFSVKAAARALSTRPRVQRRCRAPAAITSSFQPWRLRGHHLKVRDPGHVRVPGERDDVRRTHLQVDRDEPEGEELKRDPVFQLVTTVEDQSCFSFGTTAAALPSMVNSDAMKTARKHGANTSWSSASAAPAPAVPVKPVAATILFREPYQKCNAGPTRNAPSNVNTPVRRQSQPSPRRSQT